MKAPATRESRVLHGRIRSLKRRAESLRAEIDGWVDHAVEGGRLRWNRTQISALREFMARILERLSQGVAELAQAVVAPGDAALPLVDRLGAGIANGQQVWGFFRDLLAQRFVPRAAVILEATDLLAHDSYQCAVEAAGRLGLSGTVRLRERPLTCFRDWPGPATWPRNVALGALERRLLPVPVIGFPWDDGVAPWELLTLHHEVGHDVDADLGKASAGLGADIEHALREAGVPGQQAAAWRSWAAEIFADAYGLLAGGPPFISCLALLLLSSRPQAGAIDPSGPYPSSHLRIWLAREMAERLLPDGPARAYAQSVAADWCTTYALRPTAGTPYFDEIPKVVDVLLGPRFVAESGGKCGLADLIGFSEPDFQRQEEACAALLANTRLPAGIPSRHVVGAGYLAIERQGPADGDDQRIAGQMLDYIVANAPAPTLALRSEEASQHLRALADAVFDGTSDG